MSQQSQGVLDVVGAASRCGLGKSTLNKLRLTGGGPEYIKLGRRVLYEPAKLDEWMAAHRCRSTSDRGNAASNGEAA
jgi:predicted DNA-binding transcriptional regulator AlpA